MRWLNLTYRTRHEFKRCEQRSILIDAPADRKDAVYIPNRTPPMRRIRFLAEQDEARSTHDSLEFGYHPFSELIGQMLEDSECHYEVEALSRDWKIVQALHLMPFHRWQQVAANCD